MQWRHVTGLILVFVLGRTLPAAETLPAASQWMPSEVVAEVEVTRPAAVLDFLLDPELVKTIGGLPAYQKATAEPKFQQFLGLVHYLEFQLNTDWAGGVRKLLGGGVTAAVGPKGEALLAIDAADPAMLQKLHQTVLGLAGNDAKKKATGAIASTEYRGVKLWSSGDGPAHALVDGRFLLANRPDVLKTALDLRAGVGRSLAAVASYQAAKKAAGPAAVATAYLDLAAVKQNPKVEKSLKPDNPLAALLLMGVTEPLGDSRWLSLALTVEGRLLRLRATIDGKTTARNGVASFAWPQKPGDGAPACLRVPRCIAAGSFYRDLHAFYAAKDTIFPERTSGLIFFENMMGIFFTGRDLADEVLSETRPEVRFVVARQQYDPVIGTPQVQLPAFAVIFRLRHPEQAADMTEEAWQKAIGLVNFTRGQKADPGLILDRESYAGVRFTVGRFSVANEKNKTDLPTRYNIQPSIARIGDYLVLSSTERLTRDVLDALKSELAGPRQPAAGVSSTIEIDGRQLSSILEANHKVMVRQNMIDNGNTQEQAEAQIGLLGLLPKYLGQVKLGLSCEEGGPLLTLELKVNPSGRAGDESRGN
jgi:carbon monoxide dehydrogenase subunit G